MREEFENKRKLISMGFILLAIIVIVIMAVSIFGNKSKNGKNIVAETVKDTTNYTTTTEGNKVNTSEQVVTDKKVGKILLKKAK